MTALRGYAFGVYFYTVTVSCTLCFLPFLLAPDGLFRKAAGIWVSLVLGGLKAIVGVRVVEEGRENLPATPFILASKHQSTWETLAYCDLFDLPPFVLKKELRDIPLFGLYLKKLDMIAVDRSAGASALKKMIADAEKALRKGRNIIIFPEGTRMAPGKTVRYHPGVAALYANTGYPIVPAALNSGAVWPRSIWACRPGTITLRFLPAIEPGLSRKEMMALLEERIEAATGALNADRIPEPEAG